MLNGCSGSRIEYILFGGKPAVRKTADGLTGERLVRQAAKQEEYRDLLADYGDFSVPQILEVAPGLIIMERCPGRTLLDVINYRTVNELLSIGPRLVSWITRAHRFARLSHELTSWPRETVDAKIARLHKVHPLPDPLESQILRWQDRTKNCWVDKILFCHGDFTCANMLFDGPDKPIVLLDWLDTYWESPLQDAAKLLQELRLQWTWLSATNASEYDAAKIRQAYQFLRSEILPHFGDGPCLRVIYALALWRILPYNPPPHIEHAVLEDLDRVLNGDPLNV